MKNNSFDDNRLAHKSLMSVAVYSETSPSHSRDNSLRKGRFRTALSLERWSRFAITTTSVNRFMIKATLFAAKGFREWWCWWSRGRRVKGDGTGHGVWRSPNWYYAQVHILKFQIHEIGYTRCIGGGSIVLRPSRFDFSLWQEIMFPWGSEPRPQPPMVSCVQISSDSASSSSPC